MRFCNALRQIGIERAGLTGCGEVTAEGFMSDVRGHGSSCILILKKIETLQAGHSGLSPSSNPTRLASLLHNLKDREAGKFFRSSFLPNCIVGGFQSTSQ